MARRAAVDRVPRPLHSFFVSLGGALLMAAFFSDYMYANNSLMQWANFSAWLITGGLVLALVSAIVLLIEVVIRRGRRVRWLDFTLLAVAALLSIANVFIHTRDAWTSVVPSGITLSGIVAVLLLITGLRGWCVTADYSAEQGIVR
jgi:uncharacterized membrane protein